SLRPGQSLAVPGAKYVAPSEQVETASVSPGIQSGPSSGPPGPVKRETLAPPPGARESAHENDRETRTASAAPGPAATGEPTPLGHHAEKAPAGPTPRFQWPLHGKILTPYGENGGQK